MAGNICPFMSTTDNKSNCTSECKFYIAIRSDSNCMIFDCIDLIQEDIHFIKEKLGNN